MWYGYFVLLSLNSFNIISVQCGEVTFTLYSKIYKLNLTCARHNALPPYTPVWTVHKNHSTYTGYDFQRINETLTFEVKNMYEDLSRIPSAFRQYYSTNSGLLSYDGLFADENALIKVKHSKEDNSERRSLILPSVYNINVETNKGREICDQTSNYDMISGGKRYSLNHLYPKLLLIIEHHLFSFFENNIVKTINYLSLFWNTINSIYSTLDNPKITITITGVVIEENRNTLNYILKSANETGQIVPCLLLKNTYLFINNVLVRQVQIQDYDAAVTMMWLDSNLLDNAGEVGRICVNGVGKTFYVVTDNTFDPLDIKIAATKLAHLLGVFRPGIDSQTLSAYCTEDIFLSTNKYLEWAPCSIRDFNTFASKPISHCVSDPPVDPRRY